MTGRGICSGCSQVIQDNEAALEYKHSDHNDYWHVQCRRTHTVVSKLLNDYYKMVEK